MPLEAVGAYEVKMASSFLVYLAGATVRAGGGEGDGLTWTFIIYVITLENHALGTRILRCLTWPDLESPRPTKQQMSGAYCVQTCKFSFAWKLHKGIHLKVVNSKLNCWVAQSVCLPKWTLVQLWFTSVLGRLYQ